MAPQLASIFYVIINVSPLKDYSTFVYHTRVQCTLTRWERCHIKGCYELPSWFLGNCILTLEIHMWLNIGTIAIFPWEISMGYSTLCVFWSDELGYRRWLCHHVHALSCGSSIEPYTKRIDDVFLSHNSVIAVISPYWGDRVAKYMDMYVICMSLDTMASACIYMCRISPQAAVASFLVHV